MKAWNEYNYFAHIKRLAMQPIKVASPKPGEMQREQEYIIESGDRLRDNNIKPVEAAEILGVSPQFVRVAMQQEKLNIGIAIQLPGSSTWAYQISEKLLGEYTGKDIAKEIAALRNQR